MKFKYLGAVCATLVVSGCASIISDNTYPVTLDSTPSGADLRVTDRDGSVVYEGQGPTTLTLKSGGGYFKGGQYKVEATLDGRTGTSTLTPSLDGWYVGNILFGGLVGLLIVDPATGAMYRLPDQFLVDIPQNAAENADEAPGEDGAKLQIMSMNDVPTDIRGELIPVN